MHNLGFERIVCVIDGFKVKIARPSQLQYQRGHYSQKKKQFALNFMVFNIIEK